MESWEMVLIIILSILLAGICFYLGHNLGVTDGQILEFKRRKGENKRLRGIGD